MKYLSDWVAAAAITAGGAASLVLMPDVALHQTFIAWMLPATAVVVYAVLRILARSQGTAPHREAPVRIIAANAVVFIVSIHILMLANLAGVLGARALGPRAIVLLLGVVFVANGNLLPRTGPNLAVGIRTRRTLAEPQLWSRMHRLTGNVTVAFGLAVIVAGLALRGVWLGVALNAGALAVVVSLTMGYRRLTRA